MGKTLVNGLSCPDLEIVGFDKCVRELGSLNNNTFQAVDLTDRAALSGMFDNLDCIIHLAACPSPESDWQTIMANISIDQHVFDECSKAGVRRCFIIHLESATFFDTFVAYISQ